MRLTCLLPDYYDFFPNFEKEELIKRLVSKPFHIATLLGLKNLCLAQEILGAECLRPFLTASPESQRKLLFETLVEAGINTRVAQAGSAIPRERFVMKGLEKFAYLNNYVPFSEGSCTSPPGLTALMIESLKLSSGDRILEIGFGCGVHSVWISELLGNDCEIVGLESNRSYAFFGNDVIRQLGYNNIDVLVVDGFANNAGLGKFSRVFATIATKELNPELLERLSEDGIIQFVRAVNEKEYLSDRPDSWLRKTFASYSDYINGNWRSYCVIETSRWTGGCLVSESKIFDVTFVPSRSGVVEEILCSASPFVALKENYD